MRPYPANDVHELRKGIPFDIEFQLRMFRQQVRKRVHIGRTDMTLIRPRVDGDTVRAGLNDDLGGSHHVRDTNVACVSQQGYAVQINA